MDLFLQGFAVALQPQNLAFCLLGVSVGMLIGVLPGLGSAATISILLPVTYAVEPATAVIMLAGIFYGAQYGGTITSVLLRLPGEASSVVTAIDGYKMARQGRGGSALGIAAIGSFIGATVSIIGLTFVSPFVARSALSFGPPEYAALALLGIMLVANLGSGNSIKNIGAAALGLLLATVGRDPFFGSNRFTFGSDQLADGFDFVIIAMGLFGIGELLYNLEHRDTPAPPIPHFGRALPTRGDLKQSRLAILRGSVLGFFLGVLPGGGATMSSLVSYAVEKKSAKDPSRFGNGAVEGVAGPETANNAAATSSFIPLLTLGIPANATMAVLFGALMLQGITPGPTLMSDHPDIFWGVINSMYVGNIFLLILSIPLIGVFVRILRVSPPILAGLTVIIAMVGVYTVRNNAFDLLVVLGFGVLGYAMKKLGFEPAPLVLAFVLGALLETSFRQALRMFDGDVAGFVQRPISGTILVFILASIAIPPIYRAIRAKRKPAATETAEVVEVAP